MRKPRSVHVGNMSEAAMSYLRPVGTPAQPEASDPLAPDRVPPFEPRHLAALVAVAKAGSFRLAGQRLGYVQSAVSRQIATLEEVAGTRLVERARGANEVRLTQAGTVLLGHAEVMLARQSAARADLTRLATGEVGAVRIGVPQGVGTRLLRTALWAHRRQRPGARVEASEFSSDTPLFELVEQGELDLGLAVLPLAPGPFEHRNLLRVRWLVAVPQRWRLPRVAGALPLAELAGRPLVERHDERLAPSLARHLREGGHVADVVFRTDVDETVRGLVAAGAGAALMPAFSTAGSDPAIEVARLEDHAPTQVISLFWHRARLLSPAAESLRAIVCEICGRLDRPAAAVSAPVRSSAQP